MKITFWKRGDIYGLMNKTTLKNYTMRIRMNKRKVIADIIPRRKKE